MSAHEENRAGEVSAIIRVKKFSRRQFLKRTGMAAAGAAIASISLSTACKSSGITTATTAPEAAVPTTTATSASIPFSTTTSSSPVVSTSITTTTGILTSISPTTATSVPPLTGYSYTPPSKAPPTIEVTGTTCVVATDRGYSIDHIWVKTISSGVAAMGITTTLNEILFEPFKISLPKVGGKLSIGEAFGTIEGYKMTSDLLTPVSGTVLQINDFLNALVIQGTVLEPVINDPYNSGWMIVVQVTNPTELNALLTPLAYRDLVAK